MGIQRGVFKTARGIKMSYRKIGGLHFVKLGAITLSWCVSKRKNPKMEAIKALKRRINEAKRNFRMGVAI
jgi:hypothetical protein